MQAQIASDVRSRLTELLRAQDHGTATDSTAKAAGDQSMLERSWSVRETSSGVASRVHRKLAQSSGVALQRSGWSQDAETGGHQPVRRLSTCHTWPRFGFLTTMVKGSRPCKASLRSLRSLPRSRPATKCATAPKRLARAHQNASRMGTRSGPLQVTRGQGARLIEGRASEVLPWSRRCPRRSRRNERLA
jgi:hypothetical protein